MKLLTRNTDYAVRAVCYMAANRDRMVSVTEIVKNLKIPGPFLRKILQILSKKRMIKSYKGIGGGFVLVKAPNQIRLVELISIFQGALNLNECVFKKMLCPNMKKCPLKKKIDKIEKYVVSQLSSITIGQLIK